MPTHPNLPPDPTGQDKSHASSSHMATARRETSVTLHMELLLHLLLAKPATEPLSLWKTSLDLTKRTN